MKSGNLNFLEPSGPLQACNGTNLPFYHCYNKVSIYVLVWQDSQTDTKYNSYLFTNLVSWVKEKLYLCSHLCYANNVIVTLTMSVISVTLVVTFANSLQLLTTKNVTTLITCYDWQCSEMKRSERTSVLLHIYISCLFCNTAWCMLMVWKWNSF